MDAAIKSVLAGCADSINTAPWNPLDYAKKNIQRVVEGINKRPVPNTEEKELVEYLLQANKVGYGKKRYQVKMITEKVTIDKWVLRGDQISDGWWRRLLQQNPDLSLRSGDCTGYVRMNAMNKQNFKNYFDLLDTVLEENWRKLHSGRLPELLLVLARRQKEDPTHEPKVELLIWVIPFPSIPPQILCNVSLLSLQTLYQLVYLCIWFPHTASPSLCISLLHTSLCKCLFLYVNFL